VFDFPNSPTVGQIVTAPSGASYQYDGLKWLAYNAGGGTSTGDITGVLAGSGLSGGGTSGDVTLSLTTPVPYASLPTEVAQVPIVFPYVSKPAASLAVNVPMAMAMTMAANFAGSVGYCTTPPAATATFNVYKVVAGTPTSIGTVAISTGGVFTFTAASPASFAIGDVLRVTAPSSQDSALADLAISFMAART